MFGSWQYSLFAVFLIYRMSATNGALEFIACMLGSATCLFIAVQSGNAGTKSNAGNPGKGE